ncbi:hypothetical protein WM32_15980 [Burkholderia ubonensis]|nr:hypothetical protein WM32_15980 [Burkholderia ubonensis]
MTGEHAGPSDKRKNVMHESVKSPMPAIVKVAIADVEAGEQVFVIAGRRGKCDMYRDAEGRDFLRVCVQVEIDRSADAARHCADSAVDRT